MKKPKPIRRTQSAYGYPLLIKHLLNTPIYWASDQEIVYRGDVRHTYRELYRRINKLASVLSSLGVGAGDVVAVLDWDSHRYLECFYAVPMMGAVLHTVNVRLSPEQILYTMNHAEDRIVLVHEDFVSLLEGLKERLKTIKGYVLLKDNPGPLKKSSLSLLGEYEELLSGASEEYEFPEFPEEIQATIFYTTGTTGPPKGVYFSHRHLVLHTLSVAIALGGFHGIGLRSGDVYMPLTPMFHVHAWGMPYVATLLGLKQVYPGRYEPELILRLRERERVSFSHCVPTILQMILEHPLAREVDLSGWRINVGGSALPRALARKALEIGIEVIGGYGLSETCPVLSLANFKPHMLQWDEERKLNIRTKAGFPIPLVAFRLEDERGQELPRDGKSRGELLVRAPWLTQGYHKEVERSEELWRDGWLHTGDVATIDPEGYILIVDRLKDVIKSGGEWISSLELERIIVEHPRVSEAAVVGVPHEKWGERPVAFVVPKAEGKGLLSEEELKGFIRGFVEKGIIPRWAIPDRIYMVDEIPKTSVGKIDKKEIRALIRKESSPGKS